MTDWLQVAFGACSGSRLRPAYEIIVSEINNFAYYNASGGCARIL